MSKKWDLIVYGATGFTGKLVAKYLYQNNLRKLKWCVSGRSPDKLNQLVAELTALGDESCYKPDIVDADITHAPQSLEFFSDATLVLNCTGPYRFLGEPIVQACIANQTHYMDLCGEPQFIESMFLKHSDSAKQNNCTVIHSCAFDSVPADFGNLFISRQFEPLCCSSVESFLELQCAEGYSAHYTTFEAAVHGVSDIESLKSIRQEIEAKVHPPKISHVGSKLPRRSGFYFEPRVHKYCLPFMGSDASVVRLTQRILSMTKEMTTWHQYGAYAAVNSWGYMALTALCGAVAYPLASFEQGRALLLSYPGLFTAGMFSHQGPTEQQLRNSAFKMTFYAEGFSSADKRDIDKKVRVIVAGPEPGYVATPIIFVVLAECLLEGVASMPRGVLTPAVAFFDNETVIDRLRAAGIDFTVESVQ